MNKTFLTLATAAFVTTAAVGPALADKVTAWDGRDKITIGGKQYEISGKRTKVTIKVSGPAGGEATAIAC